MRRTLECHVRVTLQDAAGLPADEPLEFVRWGTSLAVPGCERVPKIVPAEIRDARPFQRLAPSQRADLNEGFG